MVVSFERMKEGFILTVDGRRLLFHSPSSPCIEYGEREAGRLRKAKRASPVDVVHEGPDMLHARFPDGRGLRIKVERSILRIWAYGTADDARRVYTLRIGIAKGEHFYGAGPSEQSELSLFTAEALGAAGSQEGRLPTAFSDRGMWIHMRGGGASGWRFEKTGLTLRCGKEPDEIGLGFGESPRGGMELLTGYLAEGGTAAAGLSFGRVRPNSPDEYTELKGGMDTAAFLKRLLSMSFSGVGFPYWGPGPCLRSQDAGAEAHLMDAAAFSPRFAYGAQDGGAAQGQVLRDTSEPHKTGASQAAKRLARAAAAFAHLAPYRDYVEGLWVKEGVPAIVHPAMWDEGGRGSWTRFDHYLFGPDLYVAPSLSSGSEAREADLPSGRWVHLWTSRRFGPGPAIVDAPMGAPAVFYREDSAYASLFNELRKAATRW